MGNTSEFDYTTLPTLLKHTNAQVVLPTDGEQYEQSIKRWSEHCIKRAAAVVKPSNPSDVSAILKLIRSNGNNIPFTVCGGGHSTSGAASIENGLVIDLSRMRRVVVDEEKRTIRVEGGALWEEVDVEAGKFGLATVGGTVNHTGVGGLTLGGGYGYLSGKYGLTIDNLLSVDIVLASGEQVVASEQENPDLFWAIRGAGQNFGVVTTFTFLAHPQPYPVFAGPLVFPPTKLPQIVTFLNAFHTKNDGNQAMLLGFSCSPSPQPPHTPTPTILTQLFHNGPDAEAQGKAFFKDLFDLEPLANMTATMPYPQLNSLLNPASGFGGRKQFSGGAFKLPLDASLVASLHSDFVSFVTNDLEGRRMSESLMLFEVVPYRKIREVEHGRMSFANRGDYYNVATCLKWFDERFDEEVRAFARGLLKKTAEGAGVDVGGGGGGDSNSEGVGQYGNYAGADVSASELYGSNAKRLEELKQKYDPDNMFSHGTRLVPRPMVVVN